MREFSEILIEITGGSEPITTVRKIAHVMGVDPQTVYAYRAGQNEPRWKDTVRLSHWLIKEYDYYALAYQTLLVCESGRADGRISDQLLNIMEYETDLHRAFNGRNRSEAFNAFAKMEGEMKILKQEIEQL